MTITVEKIPGQYPLYLATDGNLSVMAESAKKAERKLQHRITMQKLEQAFAKGSDHDAETDL